MAIRIRKVDGETVALCAAKTKPKDDDIYLDDSIDRALRNKFKIDYESEGLMNNVLVDRKIRTITMEEEQTINAGGADGDYPGPI